jgi:hypothetical protein
MTAQISFERNRARGRLTIRTHAAEKEVGSGRRSLLGLNGHLNLGSGWRVRGTWVTAWGDPVDLVSAVSPMTGLVLPRHWGHWRSESVLGLERTGRTVRIRLAASLRRPDQDPSNNPLPSCWAEAEIRW